MNFFDLLSVDQIVPSLAMTLVHFTWQAVLIALVLKIVLYFSKKQALKIRYYAAVLALSACVVWPGYTFTSIYQQNSAKQTTISQFVPQDEDSLVAFKLPIAPGNQFQTLKLPARSEGVAIDHRLLVLIWVLGVGLMAVKLIYDLRQTYQLTRIGVTAVDDEIMRMVRQISQKFEIKRRVRVLKSSLVNVPVVIGWFKPTVLLPIAISIGLERHQLELILAHELAHVKRLDFLVNLTQGLIQVLFFYHPCIYWINKVLREEREYICDSMALGVFKNTPTARLELAKALLNIEELKEGNLPLVAVAASDGHLKNRISRIVLNERLRMPSVRGLLVMLIGMIFSITTIAVTADMSAKIERERSLTAETIVSTPASSSKLLTSDTGSKLNNGSNRSISNANLEKSSDQYSKRILKSEEEQPISDIKVTQGKVNADQKLNKKGKLKDLAVKDHITSSSLNETQNSDIPVNPTQIEQAAVSRTLQSEPRAEKNQKARLDAEIHSAIVDKTSIAETALLNDENAALISELETATQQDKSESEAETPAKTREVTHVALIDAKDKSQFSAPKALETPYPIYPFSAYQNDLKGRIKVDFVIDERGFVVNPQFSEGTPWVFLKEIKSKLRRWRYIPAEKDGETIAFSSSVFFDFELPEDEPLTQYQVGTRIKRRIN